MTRLWGFKWDQERTQEQQNARAQLSVLFTAEWRNACMPSTLLVSLQKLWNRFWEENLDASPSAVGTCGCVVSWTQSALQAEQVSRCSLEVDVLEHTFPLLLPGGLRKWLGCSTVGTAAAGRAGWQDLSIQSPSHGLSAASTKSSLMIAVPAVRQILKKIK